MPWPRQPPVLSPSLQHRVPEPWLHYAKVRGKGCPLSFWPHGHACMFLRAFHDSQLALQVYPFAVAERCSLSAMRVRHDQCEGCTYAHESIKVLTLPKLATTTVLASSTLALFATPTSSCADAKVRGECRSSHNLFLPLGELDGGKVQPETMPDCSHLPTLTCQVLQKLRSFSHSVRPKYNVSEFTHSRLATFKSMSLVCHLNLQHSCILCVKKCRITTNGGQARLTRS